MPFKTTDRITVSEHAEQNWQERAPQDHRDVADVWRKAEPVETRYAPTLSALYARVDPHSVMHLLVHRETLIGVWPAFWLTPADQAAVVAQMPITWEKIELRRGELEFADNRTVYP